MKTGSIMPKRFMSFLVLTIAGFAFQAIPVQAIEVTYDLRINDTNVAPGLPFVLFREWVNHSSQGAGVDEYIILDVYGLYWFWPSWTQTVDNQSQNVAADERHADNLMSFIWPDGAGSASGLIFWGALLDPGTSTLVGNVDNVSWGYSAETGIFRLTSTGFLEGAAIPPYYTCDGEDASPALYWGNIPVGTVSLALVVQDPDAPGGNFIHWLAYDMPATTTSLPEGVALNVTLPGGGNQGKNGFGKNGYGGPCPPSGTHHYYFRLYALDGMLGLPMGATYTELTNAMTGHVVQEIALMGTFAH